MLMWVVFLVLVTLAAVIAWYAIYGQPNPAPIVPATSSNDSAPPAKEDIVSQPKPGSNQTPSEAPTDTSLKATITKLEQVGGNVVIGGTVTGSTAGTCTAKFTTPEDKPVIKQFAAKPSGDHLACGPVSIDEAEFTYLGTWKATLSFYDPVTKKQTVSATKTIMID